MNKSESIVEIAKAMNKFHAEVKQPVKNANNPYFKSKYVPLENVVEAITETATKHGLSFVQWASNDSDGRVGVSTMIMHVSGEFMEFDPVYMNADKNTAQGAGSLISYLKRYSLSAVFGITSDLDDDGNDASGNRQKKDTRQVTSEMIGQFKANIMKFAQMNNTDEQGVKDALNIMDYTKLSVTDIENHTNTLKGWGLQ